MISYGKQTIDESDVESIIEVLKGDWLTQGPFVEKFENDLNNYFGSKYSTAVSNGTAALHLTALALGWQKGDIVITTPNTFLATANSILFVGATPDFVDIDLQTYTLDPNLLEEKIKLYLSRGQKVKAVIGVDYAGGACDWKELRRIADKYDIQLINDNCHALGTSYYSSKKYAIKYADIVTQSYHPVKHITTGEGGAILTNNKEIDNKLKCLRSHGITKKPEKLNENHGPWYYEMNELGYNYRITDFQCALGSNQLKRLDEFVEKRQFIALKYDNAFKDNDNLIIPKVRNYIKHSYHLYPLQIKFEKLKIDKKKFFLKMKEKGINLQVHYIPIHLQPYYMKKFDFRSGAFINAEKFYKLEFSLPIFPTMNEKDCEMVIKSLNEVCDGKS